MLDGLVIQYLTSADMVPGRPGARADLWELEAQLAELVPALSRRGARLDLQVWTEGDSLGKNAGVVVIGTPWDYSTSLDSFLGRLGDIDVPLLNPLAIVRENADKRYLASLEWAGLPIVPTEWAQDLVADDLPAALQRWGGPIVVKKVVGACAAGQVLWKGEGQPPEPPAGAVMVQPFLPGAVEFGELSLVYFDRRFSHAVHKVPAPGDYRVQSVYGGRERPCDPPAAAVDIGRRALEAVEGELLIARVDLVPDGATWRVMELELIEPYLYAVEGPGMGERFADALASILRRIA